jgi:predicted glycosyltransferase involved in capsule biosynthesis
LYSKIIFLKSLSKYLSILILIGFLIVIASCKDNRKTNNNKLSITELPTVLFFLNTECPICKKHQGTFQPINTSFSSQYQIKYVFPGYQNKQSIIQYCQYDSIPESQIIYDTLLEYTKISKAIVTPQVVIINKGKIIYTGKIDDRFMALGSEKIPSINYVENVLISLQKNEAISIKNTHPIGCLIEQ